MCSSRWTATGPQSAENFASIGKSHLDTVHLDALERVVVPSTAYCAHLLASACSSFATVGKEAALGIILWMRWGSWWYHSKNVLCPFNSSASVEVPSRVSRRVLCSLLAVVTELLRDLSVALSWVELRRQGTHKNAVVCEHEHKRHLPEHRGADPRWHHGTARVTPLHTVAVLHSRDVSSSLLPTHPPWEGGAWRGWCGVSTGVELYRAGAGHGYLGLEQARGTAQGRADNPGNEKQKGEWEKGSSASEWLVVDDGDGLCCWLPHVSTHDVVRRQEDAVTLTKLNFQPRRRHQSYRARSLETCVELHEEMEQVSSLGVLVCAWESICRDCSCSFHARKKNSVFDALEPGSLRVPAAGCSQRENTWLSEFTWTWTSGPFETWSFSAAGETGGPVYNAVCFFFFWLSAWT